MAKSGNLVKKIVLIEQTHDGIKGLVSDVCDPAKAINEAIIERN